MFCSPARQLAFAYENKTNTEEQNAVMIIGSHGTFCTSLIGSVSWLTGPSSSAGCGRHYSAFTAFTARGLSRQRAN